MADTNNGNTPSGKTTMGKPQPITLAELGVNLTESGSNMGTFGGSAAQEPAPAKHSDGDQGDQGQQGSEQKPAGTDKPAEGGDQKNGGSQSPDPAQGTAPSFDQIKAYLKEQGLEFEGDLDALKNKLNPRQEPTEAEKQAQAEARERRLLNHYVNNLNGKPEDYVALKQLAAASAAEMGMAALRNELMAEGGFTEEQAEDIISQRYFQYSEDDIEMLDDEADKEFMRKKKAYGAKQLENRGLPHISKAQAALKELSDAIEAEDLLKGQEVAFSSKVDEILSKADRKLTFELGENNGQKIDPITYDVDEADVAEVMTVLKDPAKRQQFFYNPDNSLNIDNVGRVMLRNKFLESALKKAYLEGSTRQVETLKKVFPYTDPSEVGVGGAHVGSQVVTGKFKTAGKPQRAM